MNLFELCTRRAFRFPTTKGAISVEDLWRVPLRSRTDYNLDQIARNLNQTVKSSLGESFVDTRTVTPEQTEAAQMLEVVKHIISVKLQEEQAAKDAATRSEQRQRLLELKQRKQDAALEELSEEELDARLAALL